MKSAINGKAKYNKYSERQKETDNFWILLSLYAALAFITESPIVTDNTILYLVLFILLQLFFAGVVTSYSFFCFKPHRIKGFGAFIAIASIIGKIIFSLTYGKTALNLLFCLVLVNLIYSVIVLIKGSSKNRVSLGLTVYFGFLYLSNSLDISLSDERKLYFISALLTFFVVIFTAVLIVKNSNLKILNAVKKTEILILSALFSFCFFASSYINLNYSLDTTTAETISNEIIDKRYFHSFRSPDSYNFSFSENGKSIDLEVSPEVFGKYEIGEIYSFKQSQGFFDNPYYFASE